MQIEAQIGNPVIHDTDDYMELERRVKEADPTLHFLDVLSDRVVIVRIASRSFRYPAHPSIEWIVGRVKYMKENDL